MRIHRGYQGDVAYQDNQEYLEAQLMELNYLLYSRLAGKSQIPPKDSILMNLEHVLKECGVLSQTLEEYISENRSRIELSVIAGRNLYLEKVLEAFEEKEFFRHMMMIALLWNMDGCYQNCFEAITGQSCKELTLRDCMTVLYGKNVLDRYNAISSDLWLLPIYFPEYKEQESAFLQPIFMDGRLTDYITGKNNFYPDGVMVETGEKQVHLLAKEREWECISRSVNKQQEDCPIILLAGEQGAGKKQLLRQMLYQRQERLVIYTLGVTAGEEQPESVCTGIRYAAREAVFLGSFLALEHMEQLTLLQQKQVIDYCRKKLSVYIREIYLLWDNEELMAKESRSCCIYFHTLTEEERFKVWCYYAGQDNYKKRFAKEIELRNIANTFVMTVGQIKAAIENACLMSENEDVSETELYRACYSQLEHKLAEKTTRVVSDFTLLDLKMPKKDKEVILDVCNCIRYRNVVMQQWGFQKVVPYGAGITVLFAGPPGTGKTMAAQVIANELHMELYKVDLSQVIDKYVGETEKNIRQIFKQAKKSNSVLFFDEADAIFNKRVEASGANERFANIESSLLLQCIEEYNGIAVLATNNYAAIDPAFIRRFKYYLLFHEPDRKLRYEIWSDIFPKDTPVAEEIDFRVLADLFDITGAVIKNVALSAAYLAAADGREVMLIDILKSIKREMYKNNLILTKEKLGSLGYLYDELL